MASLGAGVMHSRAIEFGKKYNVDIHVRSSFTDSQGTWITQEIKQMEDIVVTGATLKQDMAQFVLAGIPNRPGIAATIFSEVARHKVIVDDIIQTFDDAGHANCSFTVDHSELSECKLVIESLRKTLDIREVLCRETVAKVSVVGVGMRSHTGVAQTMFTALADAQVNINAITTSEIKISCIIDPDHGIKALQAIHAAFELDKKTGK